MLLPNLCIPSFASYNELINVHSVPYHYDNTTDKITVSSTIINNYQLN